MNNKEIRIYQNKIEIRNTPDEQTYIIAGLAIPYNTETELFKDFFEQIKRGAADKSIQEHNQFLLWQHDDRSPIANTNNGMLTLINRDDGLYYEADMSATRQTKEYYEMVKQKVVTDMSFAFRVEKGGETFIEKGKELHRTVERIERLYEISLVNEGAYSDGYADLKRRKAQYHLHHRDIHTTIINNTIRSNI